jgi:hypothetical protein
MESDPMTRLASDISEATRPIYCSSCFNSEPIRHIDFDAACDRGYGNGEAVQVAMDDLILCENCVREGARLIGMTDDTDLKAHLENLKRKVEVERKGRVQAEKWAGTMEDALGARPEAVKIDHRKRPRKQLEEVA